MSALAVHYDPTLAMGPKAFTWPGPLAPEPSVPTSSILGQDLSAISESDPSMTPPSASRSLTSSPPRLSYTPDQQDMRRQQEKIRRDQKMSNRMRRTSSNSTASFLDSPPMMPDVGSAIGLPVYTSAPNALSLLSEPATSMPQSYLSSYGTPPPMGDHTQGAHVFPTAYPPPMHPSYMSMDYGSPYGTPSDYSARSSSSSLSMTPESSMMYQMPGMMSAGGPETGGHVRVVQSRPKPRCWEHGCNGRQFSTFSNLLRHQREKSGQAAKATCPNCGAEFTRTTARNGHLLHDKCKQRRSGSADLKK